MPTKDDIFEDILASYRLLVAQAGEAAEAEVADGMAPDEVDAVAAVFADEVADAIHRLVSGLGRRHVEAGSAWRTT